MTKYLSVALIFLLTSCIAPTFDPVEYGHLATLKVTAGELSTQCPALTTDQIHGDLVVPTKVVIEQSRYRRNAADVVEAAQVLLKLTTGLETFYKAPQRPSAGYCVEKLTNIMDGADRLMRAYARLETW